MKYKVETIKFSLWPQLKTHLLINGSWTQNSDQFFVKREDGVYVFDAWLDKSKKRLGWCGGFRKLNEPTSLLFYQEGGVSFYEVKYDVISQAIPEVWKADYKDIVEEAVN